jgi:hypothetical protein
MDTWESIALPILRWVVDNEGPNNVNMRTLSEAIGVNDQMAVSNEVDRLVNGGHLSGQLHKNSSGGLPFAC